MLGYHCAKGEEILEIIIICQKTSLPWEVVLQERRPSYCVCAKEKRYLDDCICCKKVGLPNLVRETGMVFKRNKCWKITRRHIINLACRVLIDCKPGR